MKILRIIFVIPVISAGTLFASDTMQNKTAPAAAPITVVGMGQSNMEKMNPDGFNAFRDTLKPIPVDLINCAVGGSHITMWMPETAYFEDCMKKFPHIDAVLWSQGEAEAANVDLPNADHWAQMFTVIVKEIQKRHPHCKIVFVQLGKDPVVFISAYPGWQKVRAQQASIHLKGVRMITANDLDINKEDPSYAHLTSESYKTLGRRYAQALQQLLAEK